MNTRETLSSLQDRAIANRTQLVELDGCVGEDHYILTTLKGDLTYYYNDGNSYVRAPEGTVRVNSNGAVLITEPAAIAIYKRVKDTVSYSYSGCRQIVKYASIDIGDGKTLAITVDDSVSILDETLRVTHRMPLPSRVETLKSLPPLVFPITVEDLWSLNTDITGLLTLSLNGDPVSRISIDGGLYTLVWDEVKGWEKQGDGNAVI